MLPADHTMSSLVQRIARQALATFRPPPARIGDEAGRSFQENHGQLQSLMSEVSAADLKLVPRKADSPGPYHHHQPPVTYMHICETDHFSMGVFLLKNGSSIPLHDHPGMHGVLKVLYGKVRIRCFDRLERPTTTTPPPPPHHHHHHHHSTVDSLRLSVLRSTAEYTPESGPCVLSPDRDNLHQIDAVDGPTAFMDILAPPYDPDNGRDCHYYTVLAEVEGQQQQQQKQPGQEVWLREVTQPEDFWCGAEPYPGPQVCL